MFQNSFSPVSQISSALAEFIQMEPPTPPVPETERSYESNFNLFKDSEKQEKKKKKEAVSDAVIAEEVSGDADSMLPQLMLMAVNKDMREMLRFLLRPEHQYVFMTRYHIRESLGFQSGNLFSPLYLEYAEIDRVRTKHYMTQQDIAKLLARRTLLIFDQKPG